jgi:hypothetical protein
MLWHVLLILLIPVAVVIVATVFNAGNKKPPSRGDGENSGRSRRPATDLDRFLEDARRRREAAERRQAPPRPPAAELVQPRPRPAARPTPVHPPVQTPVPLRNQPVPPVALPVSPPKIVVAEEAPPPVRTLEAARLTARADEAKQAPPPSPPPAGTVRRENVSPTLRQLTQLLRSPRTAGTAIVLREILDQPVCRRR